MEKRKVTLVMDDLKLGDLEAFEKATGLNLMDELTPRPVIDRATGMPVKDPDSDKGAPLLRARMSSTTHLGLIYLGLRNEDDSITFADVQNMKINAIDFDLRSGDENPLDATTDETS